MFSHLARQAMAAPTSSFDRELRQPKPERFTAEGNVPCYLIGLSVRQGAPTGIAVLQKTKVRDHETGRRTATYACRYLRRCIGPETAYPVLITRLEEMLQGTLARSPLVVEAGPSLKAVTAMFYKNRIAASIKPVDVRTIAEDTCVDGVWKVGKGSLIETTRQVLQEERMTFDDRMPPEVLATTPPVRTIYQALLHYPYEETSTVNEAFASREGDYDDLVLAVALACWYGECCQREFWIRF
jgi:hypothetical protein